jgi:hypothetical protein
MIIPQWHSQHKPFLERIFQMPRFYVFRSWQHQQLLLYFPDKVLYPQQYIDEAMRENLRLPLH